MDAGTDSLYEHLCKCIKKDIIQGNLMPGEKLPSENELTKAMGVSRITVREAIQKLVAINLVETHQGKGSFVKNVILDSALFQESFIPKKFPTK